MQPFGRLGTGTHGIPHRVVPMNVLIVEDEPLLLMLAIDMVEDAGFRSVTATNADEAIAILVARADIRIVFTDVEMPGSMNGMRLAAAVRNRWPPIDIILTSGKMRVADIDIPARGCFFAKPYDPRRVVAAMRKMAA